MIAKSVKFYYNPVSAKFEPIGYEMLNDNADEIFDDVDLIMTSFIYNFVLPKPHGHEYGTGVLENDYLLQQFGSTYQIPPNVLSKLRNANNVIPYKSNTFDCVIKQIDSFSHFTCHKWKETPPELYKRDKNMDERLEEMMSIIKKIVAAVKNHVADVVQTIVGIPISGDLETVQKKMTIISL